MKNRLSLVKDSLDLLRQVHAEIANDSNHGLKVSIGEVIVRLEFYVRSGEEDPGRVREALKVLSQGLALIPGLQRLIDMIHNR